MDQYLRLYVPVAEAVNLVNVSNRNRTFFPRNGLRKFKEALAEIGVDQDKIWRMKIHGDPGTYRFVNMLASGTVFVDMHKAVDDLTYNANLLNFLRRMKMGISPALREKEREMKSEYLENAHGFHRLMRLNMRIKNSGTILKKYESPTTVEALEAILEQEPSLKRVFTKFLEKLKTVYVIENEKPFGDLVRREAFNGTLNGLQTLFSIINKHKRDIGGCWAIKADGTQCLVTTLSCKTTKNQQPWSCDRDSRCGPDRQHACYTCLKWNVENNSCDEEPVCERTNSSCNSGCSNRNIEVPGDTVLVCVNRIFWTAAQDYMNRNFTITPTQEENEIVPNPEPEKEEERVDEEEAEEEKVELQDDEDVREEKSEVTTQIVFLGIGLLVILLIFFWNRMK
jgi:hypothetical protein